MRAMYSMSIPASCQRVDEKVALAASHERQQMSLPPQHPDDYLMETIEAGRKVHW